MKDDFVLNQEATSQVIEKRGLGGRKDIRNMKFKEEKAGKKSKHTKNEWDRVNYPHYFKF